MKNSTLTQGSPLRGIVLFTLPLLVGNIFQQFYNMADALIVGRTIGVNGLAAVGCTGPVGFFVIGLAQGMTSGFAVITAQRYGARDKAGVRRSFVTGLVLCAGVSVVLTLASVPLARVALHWMNTPDELIADATSYLRVILWGTAATMLYNHLANAMRALGDSRTPLVFLVLACVLNVFLDYALILWFGMGVAGAGVATVLAQLLSGALCLAYIVRRMPILIRQSEGGGVTREESLLLLRVGVPMGLQNSLLAVGGILLQSAMNTLGAGAVAASTAASKIDQFAAMPLSSVGLTMATYTAQNFGAKKYWRIHRGIRQGIMLCVGYSLLMCAVMLLFGRNLVSPFLQDESLGILPMAQTALRINGVSYWLLGLVFVMRGFLQGLAQNRVPALAVVIELVMRTVAAFILVRYWGYVGVCVAGPLAWLGSVAPLAFATRFHLRRLTSEQTEPEAEPPAPVCCEQAEQL